MSFLPGFTLLSAGAGSGKTYSLTGRLTELLQSGVRPAGIIATTFTNKAAAELKDRVRVRLLENGLSKEADDLDRALIGTVHSVGLRLLRRFAFEAGVSPLAEPIADSDQQRLFNESLSQVLSEARIEAFTRLSDRLGFTKKNFGEPHDFRRDIRSVTDVARANNFDAAVLLRSKEKTKESFTALLPEVLELPLVTWNNRLVMHLEQTVAALTEQDIDTTKTTAETCDQLRGLVNQLKWRGELYWHEWAKIAKLKVGAKSRDLFEELREFALSHDRHPQFRADIFAYTDLLFDTACDVLSEYDAYKKKRGLLDYTDMESMISRLLRVPKVREALRSELDLLLVDEFQDTSPIQLDIFIQLSRLARHSVWVGDPKQSIYGFRGADPALMQAIVAQTGGILPENILPYSWRSRADIVGAVNAIFVKAFSEYPAAQVALTAKRAEPEGTVDRALLHWHFISEKDENKKPGQGWLDHCIGRQLVHFLEKKPLIQPKGQKNWTPAQPGDVAILCRSNAACLRIASALHAAGLYVSVGQSGLLSTHEIQWILACLRQLVSPHDSLSLAEIRALSVDEPLETIVNDRLQWLERQREGLVSRWSVEHPIIAELHRLRPMTAELSASEMLDVALEALDFRRRVAVLGNMEQRLDNIDQLRRYAFEYEDACNRLHSAATLGGFLLWINELAVQDLDKQGSGESKDAVKVMTYHASKGLEFPVVICADLENGLRESIWGVNLVSESQSVDLDDILGNRWLRFWVNPYADQLSNTHLEGALKQSPEFQEATRVALAEEARLLYVGLTRARDYLIFPTTVKKSAWLNRVFNTGDEGIPTLDPDSDETPFYWPADSKLPISIQTERVYMPVEFDALPLSDGVQFFPLEGAGRQPHLPEIIPLATETAPWGFTKISEALPFYTFTERPEVENSAIFEAFKTLAMAWNPETGVTLDAVNLQIALKKCPHDLPPDALLTAVQQFWQACPTGRVRRFVPISEWHDGRLIAGELDLWIETETDAYLYRFMPWSAAYLGNKVPGISEANTLAWLAFGLQHHLGDKPVHLHLVGGGNIYRVER